MKRASHPSLQYCSRLMQRCLHGPHASVGSRGIVVPLLAKGGPLAAAKGGIPWEVSTGSTSTSSTSGTAAAIDRTGAIRRKDSSWLHADVKTCLFCCTLASSLPLFLGHTDNACNACSGCARACALIRTMQRCGSER